MDGCWGGGRGRREGCGGDIKLVEFQKMGFLNVVTCIVRTHVKGVVMKSTWMRVNGNISIIMIVL